HRLCSLCRFLKADTEAIPLCLKLGERAGEDGVGSLFEAAEVVADDGGRQAAGIRIDVSFDCRDDGLPYLVPVCGSGGIGGGHCLIPLSGCSCSRVGEGALFRALVKGRREISHGASALPIRLSP